MDIQSKHPSSPAPSLPDIAIDGLHLVTSSAVVLDRIKSFPLGTSCGRDGLRAQYLMDCLSGVAVAVSGKDRAGEKGCLDFKSKRVASL